MAQVPHMNSNYPLPYEETSMWKYTTVAWVYHGRKMTPEELALNIASSGYYE